MKFLQHYISLSNHPVKREWWLVGVEIENSDQTELVKTVGKATRVLTKLEEEQVT